MQLRKINNTNNCDVKILPRARVVSLYHFFNALEHSIAIGASFMAGDFHDCFNTKFNGNLNFEPERARRMTQESMF
jgi:hypothetical protein